MKAERIVCEEVRAELSARLDDEGSPSLDPVIDEHLQNCSSCAQYESSLALVRRRLRLQAAAEVPDLTRDIMRKISPQPQRSGTIRPYLRTAGVAALIAALIAGGLTLPGRDAATDVASASEIVSEVRAAALHLSEYEARFDVRERNWHPRIHERHLDVRVSYRAPDMLRVEIKDLTSYPDRWWPRTDLTLITNETSAYVRRTPTCPPATLPQCGLELRPTARTSIRRQPLQSSDAAVTDIVLPLETLASADAVTVVGSGEEMLGRETVHVRLPMWQAQVLVAAVQPGPGTQFDADSTVDLWLDAENWFPVRFSVTPPGRARPDLTATALSVQPEVSDSAFAIDRKGVITDIGFRAGSGPALLPEFRADLEPYREGRTRDGHSMATFSRGLAWLTVLTSHKSPPSNLVAGDVVRLPAVGPALYEPADQHHARVVDIYDADDHVRLESNLPRETLLQIADSVPIKGEVIRRVRTGDTIVARASVAEVLALDFFPTPRNIPPGFVAVNGTVTRDRGSITNASLRYRSPENEYTNGGIVITGDRQQNYLPASAEPFDVYDVEGASVRWAPLRGELEWVDGGTYHSVRVGNFDVDLALSIAETML